MMKITRAFAIRFSVELLILLVALLAIGSARLNPPEPEVITITTTPTPAPAQPSERVVYVQHSNDSTSDLWVVDLAKPNQARQLTFNEQGKTIHDYQATASGQYIVYSVYNRNSPIYDNVMRLTVATGELIPVTDCAYQGVWCQRFALSASGEYMMYHYKSGTWFNEMRVVDLRSQTFTQYVVYRFNGTDRNFPQPIAVGHTNKFAFEVGGNSYQLYDADTNMLGDVLPVSPNQMLKFSDNGTKFSRLISDIPQDWYPDNLHMLVAQTALKTCPDGSSQRSHYLTAKLQIYNSDTGARQSLPLAGDSASWNKEGSKIVLSTPIDACNSNQHELTIYDMQTGMKTTLPINALQPRWLGT